MFVDYKQTEKLLEDVAKDLVLNDNIEINQKEITVSNDGSFSNTVKQILSFRLLLADSNGAYFFYFQL